MRDSYIQLYQNHILRLYELLIHVLGIKRHVSIYSGFASFRVPLSTSSIGTRSFFGGLLFWLSWCFTQV
jgi:hypothetical protein